MSEVANCHFPLPLPELNPSVVADRERNIRDEGVPVSRLVAIRRPLRSFPVQGHLTSGRTCDLRKPSPAHSARKKQVGSSAWHKYKPLSPGKFLSPTSAPE